jgi:hypothetical protein
MKLVVERSLQFVHMLKFAFREIVSSAFGGLSMRQQAGIRPPAEQSTGYSLKQD